MKRSKVRGVISGQEKMEEGGDMTNTEEQKSKQNGNGSGIDIVALTSNWDYGSDGSRVGLLHLMKEAIEAHKADFLVLVGGMVSKRACNNAARRIHEFDKKIQDKLKVELLDLVREYHTIKGNLGGRKKSAKTIKSLMRALSHKKNQIEDKKAAIKVAKPRTNGEILVKMTEEIAQQINKDLPPLLRPDGVRMKIHVVTSPAYDGGIGREVVKRLIVLRGEENDIRYESSRYQENTTFKIPLKKSGRTFAVVVPTKAVWRSAFYSTNADRLLEDEIKRTTKPPCDVYAVGCGASSINRGRGEMPFQRITVPALNKLEDPRTSENMVGVRMVYFTPGLENCAMKTVSFKDLVSNEIQFIVAPEGASKFQIAIIDEIKNSTPSEASLGMLEDNLGIPRSKIEKALKEILKLSPCILDYDDESQKYFLSQDFLKREIRYSWPTETMVQDVLAGFACMHTGSIHTAYDFIINEFPKLLFQHKVTHLLSIGDHVQGLKHDLQLQGEIVSGMNNTTQEKAAGSMIATVMLKVFSLRFNEAFEKLNESDRSKLVSADVEKMVRDFMQDFLFWKGNHDEWSLSLGYDALDIMERTIWENLYRGISGILKKFNLPRISGLAEIIDNKIHLIENNTYFTLPSGLLIGGRHYYAGRTKTSSQWPQRALHHMKKANLCWVANFHVEEMVEEWSADKGLRVAMEVPTLMCTSKFEGTKGKVTDFGFGLMKVWSVNGRVLSSETNFLGINPHTAFNNSELIRNMLSGVGIGEWVDLEKVIK